MPRRTREQLRIHALEGQVANLQDNCAEITNEMNRTNSRYDAACKENSELSGKLYKQDCEIRTLNNQLARIVNDNQELLARCSNYVVQLGNEKRRVYNLATHIAAIIIPQPLKPEVLNEGYAYNG